MIGGYILAICKIFSVSCHNINKILPCHILWIGYVLAMSFPRFESSLRAAEIRLSVAQTDLIRANELVAFLSAVGVKAKHTLALRDQAIKTIASLK